VDGGGMPYMNITTDDGDDLIWALQPMRIQQAEKSVAVRNVFGM
jgi:hypothetical protein